MTRKAEPYALEALTREDVELLGDVMRKYDIEPEEEYAFIKLSAVLAKKLYPNGVKRVGRPRLSNREKIVRMLTARLTTKPRGRPESTKQRRALLLKCVEWIKSDHCLEGRGSDKKALEIIIKEFAKSFKRSNLVLQKQYLSVWQKDLSRARKERRDS